MVYTFDMTWDYSLTGAKVCAFTRARVYSFDTTRDYSLPRADLLLARYVCFDRSKRLLFNSGKSLLDKSKGLFFGKRKSKGLLLTKAKDYS